MWINFHTVFHDGEESFTNQFALWFPTTANLGNIHVRMALRLNRDAGEITVETSLRSRHGLEHWSDDEPEVVVLQ